MPTLRDAWLLRVSQEGQDAVVQQLLEQGAEPEIQDNRAQTPLFHNVIVKLLLKKGAKMEPIYGPKPLWWAANNGHKETVKLLLENRAKIDVQSEYSQTTPLFQAAENGYEAIVKLLLEKGADLETRNSGNQTPLSKAAEKGQEAIMKLLLEKGAKVDAMDNWGWTALSMAAMHGHEVIAELLLDNAAELETKGAPTPLCWAALGGHRAIVKLLLERGAKKEWNIRSLVSLWNAASREGHVDTVKMVLSESEWMDRLSYVCPDP